MTFYIGLIGSLILVTGAAWPEKASKKHPVKSVRNWLFAVGAAFTLAYSIANYIEGGTIFYIFMQALVSISSVLMMAKVRDKYSVPIVSVLGIALIVWSLYLFEGYNTIFFIIGLMGISFGYVMEMGTIKRNIALCIGSILIALFSYIEGNQIFLWLNVFFALFSGYYAIRGVLNRK